MLSLDNYQPDMEQQEQYQESQKNPKRKKKKKGQNLYVNFFLFLAHSEEDT